MTTRRVALLIILLTAWLSRPTLAELSVGGGPPSKAHLLFAGGSNDSGPFPFAWSVYRQHIDPYLALNPLGDGNSDGMGSFWMSATTSPIVAWSWFDGNDYEIVVSHWTEAGIWSTPQVLTQNSVNDFDPVVCVNDLGDEQVSWWREGSLRSIWSLTIRDNVPGPEVPLTDPPADAHHPSLSTPTQGWLGYQQYQNGSTEVFAVDLNSGGSHLVTSANWLGPRGDGDIDVQVHRRGDLLWIDWVHGDHMMAYSVYDPVLEVWSAPEQLPYTWDPAQGTEEWIAREMARVEIRLSLLRGE